MRGMVAETSVAARQLILPLFVAEGRTEPHPISSMPGVVQHTLDSLRKAAVEAAQAGLAGVMIFGIPEHKDASAPARWPTTASSTWPSGPSARRWATPAW